MTDFFYRKIQDPDIGFDCEKNKIVKLWWDKPKREVRCDAQTQPIRDSMGKQYICRCQMGAVEKVNDMNLCKRHLKMVNTGRLKKFSDLVVDKSKF